MITTIASGKGGTGKTTIATNLAALYAKREKPVLVDLDVEEPNAGLFVVGDETFKKEMFREIPEWLENKCVPCDVCAESCNYNAVIKLGEQILIFPELCHSCYACAELCPENALEMKPNRIGELRVVESAGLTLVSSELDVGREQAVPLIRQTIDFVANQFESERLKIFDAPPGTACPSLESVKDADLVILATEPTPFGLHDLKLSIDAMRQLGKRFVVAMNRFGIGDDKTEKYCAIENIPIIAKIPNIRNVAELYSKGEIIYGNEPDFDAEMRKIAEFVEGERR